MIRAELSDISAFISVAELRSFTKAAAQLSISPSALSHAIRRLEERFGVVLLTRTTRSVTPTDAGERLIAVVGPALDQIERGIAQLGEVRDKPSGTVRVTTSDHAARSLLMPALDRFLREYPDINVELSVNNGFVDIVDERYDAGIRLGEAIDRDMVAVPIGPMARMACVAARSYFERYPLPKTPSDLVNHKCINLRMPSSGVLYAWEFEKDGNVINMKVDGQLTLGGLDLMVRAVEAGHGLAMTLEDIVKEGLVKGTLVRVLEDWCPPFEGYHLYYSAKKQPSKALEFLVRFLRYQG